MHDTPEPHTHTEPANAFTKLPAIAKRLRVAPVVEEAPPSVTLNCPDGTRYDLFDLMTAFMDRLDEATKVIT